MAQSATPGMVYAGAQPPARYANRILFPDAQSLRKRLQTVIRVRGRENLQPGDTLDAFTQGWQLKCPVPLKPVARLVVLSVRQDPLRALIDDPDHADKELALEAVAVGVTPRAYVAGIMAHFPDMDLDSCLTRIEFRYA